MTPALAELAAACGVLTGHQDGLGREVTVPERTVLAVLRALGVDIDGADDAASVLADRRARPPELAPPAAVVRAGDADAGVPVSCSDGESLRAIVTAEDGSERTLEVRGADLRPGADGRRYLPIGPLPAGYHRAVVHGAGAGASCRIFAAPDRCHGAPDGSRRWGLFAPVYGLRSGEELGAGDFGELSRLMRYAAGKGASFVGTLPLLAAHYESGEISPYSPLSRLFFNELYLDWRRLAELSPKVAAFLARQDVAARAEVLRAEPLVDYQGAAALRGELMAILSADLWSQPAWRARCERFVAERPDVDDYARFRAVLAERGRPWPEWPEAERAGRIERAAAGDDAWRHHVLSQLLVSDELSALTDTGAGLYLDLPVGVSGHSYDAWRYQDEFAKMVTVGAPPDDLFTGGQNWALPPLSPHASRENGHAYFIASIRAHMRHAAMLRVDHVMGLHRLYWVPAHAPATEGAYVTYPAEELYAILAIESHRAGCAVAGEDLGTVPDYVRPAMQRYGIHRLFVGQFCTEPGPTEGSRQLQPPPPEAVASLDTHDTATFAGFVEAAGLQGDPGELMRRWTLDLAASDAAAVLVTVEDLWLETAPQNKPGTLGDEYPSWRRKLSRSLPEIEGDPDVGALLSEVDSRRRDPAPGAADPRDS